MADYSIQRNGTNAKIFLFPKQQQFIESDCDEVLFGGSLGGGKSRSLLMFALKRRLAHPNTRGLMIRRTFPELQRSLISESHKIYRMFGAKYNEMKHTWTFPNGAVQEFGHCAAESDVYAYQSSEYQDICFDEATLFTEFQIRYLMSRCRSSLVGVKTLIRYATNPGGVSHAFFKHRFVDPYEKNKIWKDPESGKSMTFIPAKLWDNPALIENNPDYVKQLKSLPEKKRLSLVEGRWDVFEGQFFAEYDSALHVLKKAHTPSLNTQKIISVDWGYAAPAAVYWSEITPVGRIYTYRELYVTQRSPKELGRDILDLTPEEEEGFRAIYLPPEIFGKRVELEDGGVPIAELMSEVLSRRFVIAKANNARVAGWNKMREYMQIAPDGLPWWQISPSCVNLIRTLPSAIFDTKSDVIQEDCDSSGEDHAIDSMRYAFMALNQVPKLILTPHGVMNNIFANKNQQQELVSSIPMGGRSGYGA